MKDYKRALNIYKNFYLFGSESEFVKILRQLRKHVVAIPAQQHSVAWYGWLESSTDRVSNMRFLEHSMIIDTWPLLSRLSMEDDLWEDTLNMIKIISKNRSKYNGDNNQFYCDLVLALMWNFDRIKTKKTISHSDLENFLIESGLMYVVNSNYIINVLRAKQIIKSGFRSIAIREYVSSYGHNLYNTFVRLLAVSDELMLMNKHNVTLSYMNSIAKQQDVENKIKEVVNGHDIMSLGITGKDIGVALTDARTYCRTNNKLKPSDREEVLNYIRYRYAIN